MMDIPAINEDLIRQYADQHASGDFDGLRNLVTIFDFQRRQMQRAEELCRTAWGEVERLSKLTQPSTARSTTLSTQPKQQVTQRQPSPRAAPPKAAATTIDMDDL